MKKITTPLVLYILLCLFNSCSKTTSNRITDLGSDQKGILKKTQTNDDALPAYKSLNGVDETVAKQKITYFYNHIEDYKNPASGSLWFSKEVVGGIIKVFDSDPQIDGFRIYFAGEPSTATGFNLSVILVATKEIGADLSLPIQSGKKHEDFYLNTSLYDLFKSESIQGKNDGTQNAGAKLYHQGNTVIDNSGCLIMPHDISVDYAEKMVANFQEPHTITTHSEWFDRTLLDNIASNPHYNGIRIYFARHPKSNDPYKSDKDAFVITATAANPLHPELTTDIFGCRTKMTVNSESSSGTSGTPPQDNGELCPSHCN
jgi:hypothetical protein